MKSRRSALRKKGWLHYHSLSIVSLAVLALWCVLYARGDPKTHLGSFFGNAIADWTGVVATVLATKYFYELGSAESRQPQGQLPSRALEWLRDHSLTIFFVVTGIPLGILYWRVDPDAKWGQVAGNILSEWTQLLGLILLTKRCIE